MKGERLNLILILVDGARIDRVEKFGNFRKIIAAGSFFPKVITYAPYTVVSMHAIFTAMYGSRNGVDNYYATKEFKAGKCKTLAEHLKEAGYFTRGDTLNDLVVPKQGFDKLTIHNEYKDDLTATHATILREMKKLDENGKNFFAYMHYSNIHTGVALNVLRKYNNYSLQYYKQAAKNNAAYNGYMQKADAYLGKMLQEIKKHGLDKNSIVLVMSDHGIGVGDKFGEKAYGAFCYDYTINAFASFIQPEIFPCKKIGNLVRTIDIMPTLLEAVGIEEKPKEEKMQGKSLMPLIRGEKEEKRIAFSETGNPFFATKPPSKPNTKSIRTEKWKLIFNLVPNTLELYDLSKDPLEKNNLAGKGLAVEKQLWQQLKREMQ